MTHTEQRLNERGINLSLFELQVIALRCATDTAVIIAHLNEHKGDESRDYKERTESNGDLVFLIVRNRKPITIMFRRSSQSNTPAQLRVNQILDISQ